MKLSTPVISTQRFHYSEASRTFAADESDLGSDFRLGRIYDDAADVGFTLESQRTGQRITFGLSHEERDAEGELQLTEFRPVESDLDLRVVLFND